MWTDIYLFIYLSENMFINLREGEGEREKQKR